ncbi:MAG: nitroreductase family protein [Acidimicrobiales bacterium]|nr:nitroreductase family protein [Acidimicrobiales bacterium]
METNETKVVPGPGSTLADVEHLLDMPLQQAMMTQRAVRRVHPDPVDDAIILRLIELAMKAPTGSNSQSWEFVVVKDRAVKEKLQKRYRQAWSLYGSVGRRIAGGDEKMLRLMNAVKWQVDNFADIPVLIVACLRTTPRSGHLPYVPLPHIATTSFYGSIYPSVQNLLLAARAVNLGASLITLPLWSVTSARSILGIPLTVTPVCIVPIGWARGRYGPTTRRPVGEVVHLDQYGNRPWQGVSSAR